VLFRSLDLGAVGGGERFDAADALAYLQRVGVDFDGHPGGRRVDGVDHGLATPSRHLDGEVVAGFGSQPGTGRLDHEPAGLRAERVPASGDLHEPTLTPPVERRDGGMAFPPGAGGLFVTAERVTASDPRFQRRRERSPTRPKLETVAYLNYSCLRRYVLHHDRTQDSDPR